MDTHGCAYRYSVWQEEYACHKKNAVVARVFCVKNALLLQHPSWLPQLILPIPAKSPLFPAT